MEVHWCIYLYVTAQIKCKWCGRCFSHPAAKHHIPFCEKWTKEHGTPLNPAGKTGPPDAGSKSHRGREVCFKLISLNILIAEQVLSTYIYVNFELAS
jgi:hypothetical protein